MVSSATIRCGILFLSVALSVAPGKSEPTAVETKLLWWDRETALSEKGSLDLSQKPWWSRAQALKPNEQFHLSSDPNTHSGQSIVRCENVTLRKGKKTTALVWILDDDGDMRADDTKPDLDSDCYVADYNGDGLVDRMVDYIDNDADNRPDEMDIRYFSKGILTAVWIGVDLDGDGKMYDLTGYEYSGNFFRSDPSGNNLIYANQYDPIQKRWWPISECPFAFIDTNGKGRSNAVVRISAVPLDFDPLREPDLGNAFGKRFSPRMRTIGAVNVRYSIDLDGQNSPERPLHYDCGFNMPGRMPYQFPNMAHTNERRRSPKTTYCIPHADARRLAETYPAEQTGFSWREFGDPLLNLGDPPHSEECRRWEGVFWTWKRRIIHDTGGPVQDWNVRREFDGKPSNARELYYSRVDRRIHLKNATEGWTIVGHLGNDAPWGEIRTFDTNADGYFDRWEIYRNGSPIPARVSTVLNAGNRTLPSDWNQLQRLYLEELLPEALSANRKLIDAIQSISDIRPSANLTKALEASSCDSERQYISDVIREELYLALREQLQRQSAERTPPPDGKPWVSSLPTRVESSKAWEYTTAITRLDVAYAEGRYDDAVAILRELEKSETVKWSQ
jgi:hypothetical protein